MQNTQRHEITKLRLAPGEVETILNAGMRGLCVTDTDLRCRYATPFFCELLGLELADVAGRPVVDMLWPNGSELDLRLAKNHKKSDFRLVRADGGSFPARMLVEELWDAGVQTGYLFFVRDLTEEKYMEDVLRKSEKLAAAGRMAAVIAHEINNPLEAVTNLLYLLRNEPLSKQADRFLSLAESEVERVSRIARQTLGFYRETGKPTRIDLREILNMSVDVHTISHPDVSVHRRYRTSKPVTGYGPELQQVFHNLIGNALDAGSTRLFLHLRDWTEPPPSRREGVQIAIGDNGSGIDPAIRAQIFNPFITTKGESGTGLGLWTSRGIISRHEGSIRVRSTTRPGRSGTCFLIFLPLE